MDPHIALQIMTGQMLLWFGWVGVLAPVAWTVAVLK